MRVFVYFNLHKKLFSIKAMEGANRGRVVAHSDEVFLTDAVFKVSEAGRQRVLRERRKNVHAGVLGQWQQPNEGGYPVRVTYNPYKYSSFVEMGSEVPVHSARRVHLKNRQIMVDIR
jgi:hypothetical protein